MWKLFSKPVGVWRDWCVNCHAHPWNEVWKHSLWLQQSLSPHTSNIYLVYDIDLDYDYPDFPAVSEMVREAEDKLLSAVTSNQFHVLRRLFPPTIERKYSLCPRKHDFVLPPKDDKNFIPRVLYSSLLNRYM